MKWLTGLLVIFLLYSVAATAQSYQQNGTRYAPVKEERYFVFDPKTEKWTAFINGRKVASGPANGGRPGLETPEGVYHIHSKMGPDYRSSRYPINPDGTRGGAQMPYAMHFTGSGHAIHGAPSLSRDNSTHGCIRVTTSAAKWLSESFITPNTKVIVYSY